MKIEMMPMPEVGGVLLASLFGDTSQVHVEADLNAGKSERFTAVVLDMPIIQPEYCMARGNTPNWALQNAINQAEAYIKKLEGMLGIAKANVLLA